MPGLRHKVLGSKKRPVQSTLASSQNSSASQSAESLVSIASAASAATSLNGGVAGSFAGSTSGINASVANMQYGSTIIMRGGRSENILDEQPEVQRIMFDLEVNRFFRVARRVLPKLTRKAVYWWLESPALLPQNTYPRGLMTLGCGYPLWKPTPNDSGPLDVVKRGVQIGDIGVLGPDGGFTYLFNICESRESNKELTHVCVDKCTVDQRVVFEGGTVLRSAGYQLDETTGTYLSSMPQGGLLSLPAPVYRHDICDEDAIRKLALEHGRDWYETAYRLHEGTMNGCLYVITGHDTTSASLMAAHYSQHTVGLKLEPKAEKPGISRTTLAWNEDVWSGGVQKSCNPPKEDKFAKKPLQNQTVFLRGFRIKIRHKTAITSLDDGTEATFLADLQRPSISHINELLEQSTELPLRIKGGAGSEDRAVHSTRGNAKFPAEELYHPSDVLNTFLLEKLCPQATISVVHDDEWTSLILEEDEVMPDDEELIRRWLQNYTPGRNTAIEYNRSSTPRIFMQQNIIVLNSKSDSYDIQWNLVLEVLGERYHLSEGTYHVDPERLRLQPFLNATMRWNVDLTTSNGIVVLSQGAEKVRDLLAWG